MSESAGGVTSTVYESACFLWERVAEAYANGTMTAWKLNLFKLSQSHQPLKEEEASCMHQLRSWFHRPGAQGFLTHSCCAFLAGPFNLQVPGLLLLHSHRGGSAVCAALSAPRAVWPGCT